MVVLPLLLPFHADPENQPPPLDGWQFLTAWAWDWWIAAGLAVTIGLYLVGVARLRGRGDAWPLVRTLSWCLGGAGTIAVATLSFLGSYDTVLFSVHMVQHLLLSMVAPMLMAVGAPVTLLLRNLGAAGRRRVSGLLHSWPVRVLAFPPLATAVMIANPYVLYLSDLYPLSLENGFVHNWLHLHFVITGCLFFWPLMGTDPMPIRIPYPFRLLLMMITLPFHAFLGVTIMGMRTLIAENWYLSFNRSWPPSPQDDQYLAGAIMWGAGDLVMVLAHGVIFVQWYRASKREAAREDRRLDREERLAEAMLARSPRADQSPAGSGYDARQIAAKAGDEDAP